MFRYLHYGLSAILIFIGAKMLLHSYWEPNHWMSLGIIVALLGTSIVASLWAARRELAAGAELPKSDSAPPADQS
jgi:tellurite resistance protein TerC